MRTQATMRQRKLALVLLDLVGSTAFVQKVGALRAANWFQKHDRLTRSICYKYNGREIDRSDGFLMSFETVSEAVKFALSYRDNVTPKIRLEARIGIHWGSVIEVTQGIAFVEAGAKSVELEGLSKNIAARTMSLAEGSQILLTKPAFIQVTRSLRNQVPEGMKIENMGVYRFKGVIQPQEVFAIGNELKHLKPPKGNDKIQRLGGPKYIKKYMKYMALKDWAMFILKIGYVLGFIWTLYVCYWILRSPGALYLLGLEGVSNWTIPFFRFVDAIFMWLNSLVP